MKTIKKGVLEETEIICTLCKSTLSYDVTDVNREMKYDGTKCSRGEQNFTWEDAVECPECEEDIFI